MSRRYDPVSMGSPRFTTVEVGAFQITRARFPAGLVLPAHVHERACVATTMSGAWNSVLDRRPRDCRMSTLLVEPAGERHSNHFDVPTDVLVVQPDSREGDLLQPCLPLLGAVHCFRDPNVGALARRLTGELTARDRLAPLVIEGLALELIATAARGAEARVRPAACPGWIRRARERLHDAPADGVSISAIAADVGVHPVHLARMFRACYGASPGAYARRVRLDRAAERLAATDAPLAAIAADAGFADQSHFTRAFRQHTGLPPGAYRRRMRG
jgi:AraC family transcriptional regulator